MTPIEILWHVNKTMDNPIERHHVGSHIGPNWSHLAAGDGFMNLAPAFTPAQIQEMRDYFAHRPVFEKDGCVNHVPAQDVMAYDGIVEAAMGLEPLAEAYLGCPPVLAAVACFWTHPTGEPTGLNEWHRDRDDFRALKIFTYLTDVDMESGPHQFIPLTHRHGGPPEFYKGNCRDRARQIQKHYEADIHSFTGPVGMTWAENTYGLHRGLSPVSRPRGILEFLFTQNAYPAHKKLFGGVKISPPAGAEYLFQHVI